MQGKQDQQNGQHKNQHREKNVSVLLSLNPTFLLPHILCKEAFQIVGLFFVIIQIAGSLANDEIRLQFIIAGRTVPHMMDEILHFIFRHLVLHIRLYQLFCSFAIHCRHPFLSLSLRRAGEKRPADLGLFFLLLTIHYFLLF